MVGVNEHSDVNKHLEPASTSENTLTTSSRGKF